MVTQTIVLEYAPETGHYTATVPGYPAIVADAKTERSAIRLATEAIRFHQEHCPPGSSTKRALRQGNVDEDDFRTAL